MTAVYDAPDAAAVLWYGEVQAYAQVATTTLTFWNFFTHIGQEVELIWRRDLSRMTLLYAVLRYGGLMYALDQLMYYINNTPAQASDELCLVWYTAGTALELVVCSLVGAMLVIRVNALMGNPPKLGWFLWTILGVSQSFAVARVVLLSDREAGFDVWSTMLGDGISVCSCRAAATRGWTIMTAYGLTVAFQLLLALLSIYRFRVHVAEARTLGPNASRCCWSSTDTFLGLLVRDHVLYFLLVFVQGIIHVIGVPLHLPANSTRAAIWSTTTLILNMIVRTTVGPYLFLSVRQFDAMRVRTLMPDEIALSVIIFSDGTNIDHDEANHAVCEVTEIRSPRGVDIRVADDTVPPAAGKVLEQIR